MSETSFQMFNRWFPVGADLLYAVYLAAFLRPFMTGQKRKRAVIAGAAYLALRLVCGQLDAPQGTFSLLTTSLLTAASGMLGLSKAPAFLLALLYWTARTSAGLMAQSLFFLLERALPASSESLENLYLRAAVLVICFLLCHAVLSAAMLYVFQRQMRKRRTPLHRREVCYISLIPAAGILFGQIISKLLFEYQDGIFLQLYERHPAFLAAVPLLALLFWAGTFLTIAFQQGMAALREEQAAYIAERRQTQAIQARIREMEQFYDSIRWLKHEMRGHLTNIKGLARSGAYGDLETYIAQMDAGVLDSELAVQTGNPVTDVIVNDKRQRCLDLGIRFQANFHYPDSGGYDAFDIGIILQNLLENAVEACEKTEESRRFITLTGKQKGRFFLIEVKNASPGPVNFKPDGLPATTKRENASLHGIGLANVRREAEKYMGELELNAEPQKFCAAVLLQERSNL